MKRMLLLLLIPFAGCDSPKKPPQDDTVISIPVPEFSLTERNGPTMTNADLKGKVWLASFVFTRCTGPCPQVSATMAQIHSDYAREPNVRFVTFTIDPDRDKLDDLKAYAKNFRADPEDGQALRWYFLTGPETTVHDLATTGFKILAKRSATPKPGEEFDHSSKIAVVDKFGVIRGYFDGLKSPNGEPKLAQEQFETNLAVMKLMIDRLLKE